jgi:hypothetical protein
LGYDEGIMPRRYERGDYVKVEFSDETTGIGEWMWVRVRECDDERRLVFGTLDNEPLGENHGNLEVGSELAISYSQIREHYAARRLSRSRSFFRMTPSVAF